MNYRCKLESNWPLSARRLNRDRNDRYDQKRNDLMCGQEKNFTRRKNVIWLASLLLRECFGRSSIAHTHRLLMQVSVTRKGQR